MGSKANPEALQPAPPVNTYIPPRQMEFSEPQMAPDAADAMINDLLGLNKQYEPEESDQQNKQKKGEKYSRPLALVEGDNEDQLGRKN